MTPGLVLGPLLRYVGDTEAIVWVETDAPCEVEVLGSRARTFTVDGHHYGLVRVTGLAPASEHEYRVALDGAPAWPPPRWDFPPSVIRTYPREETLRIAFGSCRVALPHEPPWTLARDEGEHSFEVDALYALARRMRGEPRERWPHLLLMLGDQVYADEVSPRTREMIERRRDTDEGPGERVADFEEYACLYHEAWGEPTIRWLLSTVSSAMIFDDHDVHDDWNISGSWVRDARAEGWWDEHIIGAFMSYWLYQHLGNLAPAEHEEDELLARVLEAEDAGPLLREFALRADRETAGSRWSYCRDVGGTRLVVIDSRAGRVLSDERRRRMVDDDEWAWIEEHAVGGHDHLIIATSLPFLLPEALHHLEAWSERICAGAWGRWAAWLGERLRRALDLEHWAAFNHSFRALAELQRAVAAGERGPRPASVVTLSGDVHHAYLTEVGFRRDSGVRSPVFQAVCSPFRNPLEAKERRVMRAAWSRTAAVFTRALARAAGVPAPPIAWRLRHPEPFFDNQVGTLLVEGRRLTMRLEKTLGSDEQDEGGEPRLERVLEERLAEPA